MIPLSVAENNTDLVVRRIGGNPEIRRHLENLGFVVGAVVRVVADNGGNVIVNVKDSRVAVSESAASHVFV